MAADGWGCPVSRAAYAACGATAYEVFERAKKGGAAAAFFSACPAGREELGEGGALRLAMRNASVNATPRVVMPFDRPGARFFYDPPKKP